MHTQLSYAYHVSMLPTLKMHTQLSYASHVTILPAKKMHTQLSYASHVTILPTLKMHTQLPYASHVMMLPTLKSTLNFRMHQSELSPILFIRYDEASTLKNLSHDSHAIEET